MIRHITQDQADKANDIHQRLISGGPAKDFVIFYDALLETTAIMPGKSDYAAELLQHAKNTPRYFPLPDPLRPGVVELKIDKFFTYTPVSHGSLEKIGHWGRQMPDQVLQTISV